MSEEIEDKEKDPEVKGGPPYDYSETIEIAYSALMSVDDLDSSLLDDQEVVKRIRNRATMMIASCLEMMELQVKELVREEKKYWKKKKNPASNDAG